MQMYNRLERTKNVFSRIFMVELALAGTIVGALVAAGAHLVVRVANFVQAVEDAPQSIRDVESEVRSGNNILKQLKDVIQRQPKSLSPEIISDLDSVANNFTRVSLQSTKLVDRLGRPKAKQAKFLFIFYDSNITAARSSLQAQKASLTLMLQLALR